MMDFRNGVVTFEVSDTFGIKKESLPAITRDVMWDESLSYGLIVVCSM